MKQTNEYAGGQATDGEMLFNHKGKLVRMSDLPKDETGLRWLKGKVIEQGLSQDWQ